MILLISILIYCFSPFHIDLSSHTDRMKCTVTILMNRFSYLSPLFVLFASSPPPLLLLLAWF